jgi:hypothetical protein
MHRTRSNTGERHVIGALAVEGGQRLRGCHLKREEEEQQPSAAGVKRGATDLKTDNRDRGAKRTYRIVTASHLRWCA